MQNPERPYDAKAADFLQKADREIGVDESPYASVQRLLTEVREDLDRPTYEEERDALQGMLLAKLDVAAELAASPEERKEIEETRQDVLKGSGTAPHLH